MNAPTNYNYKFTYFDGEVVEEKGFLVFTDEVYAVGQGDAGNIVFSTPVKAIKHVRRMADLSNAN